MTKLTFELELPDNFRKHFIESGIKEEDVDNYVRNFISKPMQALLNKASEFVLATKSKALSPQEVAEKISLIVEEAQKTEREIYDRKQEETTRG